LTVKPRKLPEPKEGQADLKPTNPTCKLLSEIMSSTSPVPLLSESSDKRLSELNSANSFVPAKRLQDDSPSDNATKRSKGRTNINTWNEAREPYKSRGEKARDNSYHEIWYCKHCGITKKPNSVTTNLSRARKHLREFHGIRVLEQVEESDIKKQQNGTITDMFGKQEERQANRNLEEEKYLLNAINIPAFEEALARLLAVRNLIIPAWNVETLSNMRIRLIEALHITCRYPED
jgi:hypothetical protein